MWNHVIPATRGRAFRIAASGNTASAPPPPRNSPLAAWFAAGAARVRGRGLRSSRGASVDHRVTRVDGGGGEGFGSGGLTATPASAGWGCGACAGWGVFLALCADGFARGVLRWTSDACVPSGAWTVRKRGRGVRCPRADSGSGTGRHHLRSCRSVLLARRPLATGTRSSGVA